MDQPKTPPSSKSPHQVLKGRPHPILSLTIPDEPTFDPKQQSIESIKNKAAQLLLENQELRAFFLDKDSLKKYDESADKKLFLQLFTRNSFAISKKILIYRAAVDKVKELRDDDFEIAPKTEGINSGFIISTPSGARYFTKSFLNSEMSGKKKIHEYFIYKLLQYCGYGPKIHFSCHENMTPVIISEDLTTLKADGTKKEFAPLAVKKDYEEFSPETEAHIIASELLANLLGLADFHKNNIGFVQTSGPKTVTQQKIKPKIIDFHLDPTPEDLNFDLTFDESGDLKIFGHAYKIKEENLQKLHLQALKNLLNGTHRRPPLKEAVGLALRDCETVCAQMSQGFEAEDFQITSESREEKEKSPIKRLIDQSSRDESLMDFIKELNSKIDVLQERIRQKSVVK